MSSVVRNALPLIVTATLLAACGGGGVSLTPAKTAAKTTIAPGQGTLALTISIPHPAAASVSKRSAAYISSSTQSIAITIASTAPVLQEAVGLTPASNPNCTTVSSTTTCAITIGLAAGSFSATFATYDGPVVSGAATGNLLSQGQSIPVTITAGQTNTVTATLDGVPTSITIAPSSGSTITGTQSGGFTVPYSAQGLTIEALDADNNVILGPGAPTFTVTATATKYTVTQPASGTPNQITLESATGGSGTLAVTATPPDGGFSCSTTGVVCTASATLASTPHTLFEATSGSLVSYTSPDDVTWTAGISNSSSTIGLVESLNLAPNGDLLIQSVTFGGPPFFMSTEALLIFAPPYTGTPTSVALPGSQVGSAVMLPNGTFAIVNGTTLYAIAPPYTGAATTLTTFAATPAITADTSGDIITSLNYNPYITQLFTPPYTTGTTISTVNNGSLLAVRPSDNTLAIGSNNTNPLYIAIVPTPYTSSTVLRLGFPTTGNFFGMAFDTNGNLWAAIGSEVYEYTTPFSSGELPALSIGFQGHYFAADSSGGMIVTPQSGSTSNIYDQTGNVAATVPYTGGLMLYEK